jgi:hypothetical protein
MSDAIYELVTKRDDGLDIQKILLTREADLGG